MGSSRLPGKVLADLHGHPMVEHVYRRVQRCKLIDDVYLATCDEEIADVGRAFGAKVIMTSVAHTRGTDRVAEAAENIAADWVINIQGDEPMLDPASLDAALAMVQHDERISCVQMVAPIRDWDAFVSPNNVKTVAGTDGKVLYFSRQPIPSQTREDFSGAVKQIGIYLMRRELLLQFARWPSTPLEITEKIDMLRFIENGVPMHTFVTNDMLGVDTPEQLSVVGQALLDDPLYRELFGAR